MTRLNRRALIGSAVPGMPFIGKARAEDPLRIGLLLAKTGGISAQTEYLAQGT